MERKNLKLDIRLITGQESCFSFSHGSQKIIRNWRSLNFGEYWQTWSELWWLIGGKNTEMVHKSRSVAGPHLYTCSHQGVLWANKLTSNAKNILLPRNNFSTKTIIVCLELSKYHKGPIKWYKLLGRLMTNWVFASKHQKRSHSEIAIILWIYDSILFILHCQSS